MVRKLRIAVEGCAHGELDQIYKAVETYEQRYKNKIDLLIICGDFQSLRCPADLDALACPDKYKRMGDFRKYYTGEAKAYVPTIFVGGNHEASSYLWELFNGGWVAPNIYFLGFANVINIGGLRIGGLSGIHAGYDYNLGFFERQPFDQSNCRSVYHMRSYSVQKMLLLKKKVDIMVSHDWPSKIWEYGDKQRLLRSKPFFEEDMRSGKLGNPALLTVLESMVPKYWFAAHLHTKFAALYTSKETNLDKSTKFLALDKCLPRRQFMQILEVEVDQDDDIENGGEENDVEGTPLKWMYDEEWIAILRSTAPHFPTERVFTNLLPLSDLEKIVSLELEKMKSEDLDYRIPENFVMTASSEENTPKVYINEQTVSFCDRFSIPNFINTSV